jgi:hypothetical protein
MSQAPRTGGVALSMDDLRIIVWCVSVVEIILEGPKGYAGLPPLEADQLLPRLQLIREALSEPEPVTVLKSQA